MGQKISAITSGNRDVQIKVPRANTWDELTSHVTEANTIATKFKIDNGAVLTFALEAQKIDRYWKSRVRISVSTDNGNTSKTLGWKQFYLLFSRMKQLADTEGSVKSRRRILAKSVYNITQTTTRQNDNECVICMERDAETCLPCNHAFCNPCLKEWENKSGGTCPMCRCDFATADEENWVLTSLPTAQDLGTYITDYFSVIT
mmetsp:Transcript_2999/g.3361  ORF Transcript_2999/g.3361 Transcript_2999/m.3361 type:complete len:203 (+) Transcript_2999:17-625(+)